MIIRMVWVRPAWRKVTFPSERNTTAECPRRAKPNITPASMTDH